MLEILEKEVLGNTLENWGVSVIIILVAIVVIRLLSLINKRIVRPFTKKTKNRFDDMFIDALESPLMFAVMLLGIWIAIHRLMNLDNFIKVVDVAYRILIVLNATWFFARLANNFIEEYWVKDRGNGHKQTNRMMPVVKRTILVIVWIIGIITALSNVDVNISALLGTLGIGGIAFALAAQDTIKNIFGAFTILTDKPFSIGDVVRIDNFEGTIIDIGARSTKMRDYDRRIITIPNYKVSDAPVINISAEPMRRVVMKLGLTYNTTPEDMAKAIAILKDIPSKVEFVSPKDLVANFSDFLDSALVVTFVYFIEKKGDIRKTSSDVNMEILTAFNEAGLSFAFPTQTVYFEKGNLPKDESKETNA